MTIYYVDATLGLDGNNGTSELTPWKTLDKADDGPYSAGDTIKLKKGEEWREAYSVPSDGSAGSPITLTSYGSGADPIINGAALITTWTEYAGWAQDLHDDFEDGTLDYWTVQGDCVCDAESKYAGNFGMHCDFPAVTGRIHKACTSANRVKADFYWQLNAETFENGEECAVVRCEESGQSTQMVIFVGQSGGNLYLSLARGGDWVPDDDFEITTGQWYHIVVDVDQSGNMTLTVDDDLKATETATSSNNITAWFFGNYIGAQESDADTYFDDIYTYRYMAQANTWQATCTTEPGAVWFDGTKGTKESSIANLNATREWFWVGNVLYVYSTSDPDTAYTNPGIEAEAQTNCIWCSKDYITVSGLDIKYGENGIKFSGASHPTVNNCTVHDIDESGIVFFNTADNITVASCTVYSCGSDTAHSGIYIDDTTTGTISDCTIYDIHTGGDGRGISLIDSSAITIEGCTIYDNGDTASDGVAIEMYNADSCIICYNEGYGSYNIVEIQTGSDNNQFYYNIFRDDTGNALIEFGVGQTGNEFYNNVLAAPNEDCMTCYSGVGNTIKNNIFHGVAGSKHCIYYDAADYATLDNNCYDPNTNGDIINDVQGNGARTLAEWQSDSSQDADSMVADPLFVDADNDNYNLQSGSPCINAGVDVDLTLDYLGDKVPRGTDPDIGAYEHLNKKLQFLLI